MFLCLLWFKDALQLGVYERPSHISKPYRHILGRPTQTDIHTHTHSGESDGGGTENTTKIKTNTKSSRGPVAGRVFPIHTCKQTHTCRLLRNVSSSGFHCGFHSKVQYELQMFSAKYFNWTWKTVVCKSDRFNKVFRPSALRNVTCVDARRTPFITEHNLVGLQTQCAYLQIQVSYIVHWKLQMLTWVCYAFIYSVYHQVHKSKL